MDRSDGYGEVFNIGSTEEVAILDLAERVKAATRSGSETVLVPYDQAYEQGFEDMQRRVPDIGKIGEFLGWHPTQTLDQILAGVIESQRAPEELARSA